MVLIMVIRFLYFSILAAQNMPNGFFRIRIWGFFELFLGHFGDMGESLMREGMNTLPEFES